MERQPWDAYVGIDAGGTQTRALLGRADGGIAGVGKGGASNWNNVGLAAAVEAMRTAVQEAWAQTGERPRRARTLFVGSAGIKAEGDRRRLAEALAAADLAEPEGCAVGNDTETALAGGLLGRPGIALVAGTGSFCIGCDSRGRRAQCGGWGWALDDIGSGFYIGREALRAVVFASDGVARATALTSMVLAHYGVSEPDELPGRIYGDGYTPGAVAGLVPKVIDCARSGDPAAMEILRSGAAGLGRMVETVAQKLSLDSPEWMIFGGAGCSGPPYQTLIEDAVRQAIPGAKRMAPALPPVAGATLRAYQMAGVVATSAVVDRLRSDARRLAL